jgi:hypothetical protein
MFFEGDGFRFHFSMCASVDELRVIIGREGILSECTGTCNAIARCCILFRESGQFEVPISFAKIGSRLGIDAKTVWNHWRQFKKFGFDHDVTGRPRLLPEAQMDAVVDFALAEFHALRPASCNRLLWSVRFEFHIDLIPDSFQVMLRRDPRLKAIGGPNSISDSSNQVQPLDLCVFGIIKRLVVRLNQMGEANIQLLHIAKLFSGFHSACNSVNIIASFHNAGTTFHLNEETLPMCHVNIEHRRCLLHQFDVPSTSAQEAGAEPPGEVSGVTSQIFHYSSKCLMPKPHCCLKKIMVDLSK